MTRLRTLRLLLSALVFLSIYLLLDYLQSTRPEFSAFKFFCYFTNQSNLLVAFFFILEAALHGMGRPLSRNVYDRTRGALILYMMMTTSIYWLFLHHLVRFNSSTVAAANMFLHSGALAVLLVDWFFHRPETRMCKRFFVIWLIYPIVYGAGIMLLGSMRGWYPYPFLNIDQLGVQKWAIWNSSMAMGIGVFAVIVILINNRLRRDPT